MSDRMVWRELRRDNRDGSALGFWLKQGARVVDVNGEDYEMELRIRL